jgi:hypothetical protein
MTLPDQQQREAVWEVTPTHPGWQPDTAGVVRCAIVNPPSLVTRTFVPLSTAAVPAWVAIMSFGSG